jgi:hypothetical protein
MKELVRSDVRAYARLAARLAVAGADREALLQDNGLDDEAWDEIEQSWLEQLSQAEEEQSEGVPVLLTAYADAFAAAQAELSGSILSFERYLEITRAMSTERDMLQLLERFGVDLATYLSSHRHWAARLATDPELADQLKRAMR